MNSQNNPLLNSIILHNIYFFTSKAYEVCKRRIIGLNACLPGIPQHFTDNERDIHMSSLVPFDSISMVKIYLIFTPCIARLQFEFTLLFLTPPYSMATIFYFIIAYGKVEYRVPYPTIPCSIILYLTLHHSSLHYPILPYPTLLFFTLPYPTPCSHPPLHVPYSLLHLTRNRMITGN